ncbi:hypothetical protein BS78_07G047700 [Paspalum vaginatum]|nr:hypothetical protein BS78_07G047700 [Paspalum vaginatum]
MISLLFCSRILHLVNYCCCLKRYAFAYMASGRTRLLVSAIGNCGYNCFEELSAFVLWVVVIPFMTGLLVDCLLISPLVPILGCGGAAQPAVDEAELLLQIKRAWGDPPQLAAWSTTGSAAGEHCHWPYVACDSAGRVTRLSLSDSNLTGPLPDAIGSLLSLIRLELWNNSITGAFPTALYRCSSLRVLYLSYNQIGGELPGDIGHGLAASLRVLDLGSNLFNGTIPTSVSRLRNLSLVGDFPTYVLSMPDLEILYLSENSLIGTIPPGVWSLKNLSVLSLNNNYFSGVIPMGIGLLPSLYALDLSNNMFTGTIPLELGKHSPRLSYVYVYNNELTGGIPEGICAGRQLQYFHAWNNQLTGSIPAGLMNCATLIGLNLNSNQLSGDVS